MQTRSQHWRAGVLLLLGLALRLAYLIVRGPLWGDEGALAVNIVTPSFQEVADPFVLDQICPYGFLILAKVVTVVLGSSDAALRTFPLVMGMAACVLIYVATYEAFGLKAALIALGCAVVSPQFIYYATELKPYSTDAAVSALMLTLTFFLLSREGRAYDRLLAVTALVGAVCAWMSLPSVMVLGGVGVALFYDGLTRRMVRRRLPFIVLIGIVWVASFACAYVLIASTSPVMSDEGAVVYWSEGFFPFPPTSLAELKWPVAKFFYAFVEPGGFRRRYLAGLVWLAGFGLILVRHRRHGIAIGAPLVMLLIASALQRYPALSRLMLFVFPIIVIPIGYALAAILDSALGAAPRYALAGVLLLALMAEPTMASVRQVTSVHDQHGVNKAVELLAADYQDGDLIYIDGIEWQYFWYAYRQGFDAYAVGVNDIRESFGRPGEYPGLEIFAEQYFGHPRVWLVLSNVAIPPEIEQWDGAREALDDFIPAFLAKSGGVREVHHPLFDATLLRYDLSNARTSTITE